MNEKPYAKEPRPPATLSQLQKRLTGLAGERGITCARLQSLVANTIVAQLLPDSAVKGGTGIKLRLGDTMSRDTPDLDTAYRGEQETLADALRSNLLAGWGDFAGTLVQGETRAPESVPEAYAMQPYKVKLTYKKKPFCTVTLEVGWDELGATGGQLDMVVSGEVREIFAAPVLPEPNPVPVIPVEHQIAQKIHASTEPGSMRAHDLVDIQILSADADIEKLQQLCERLFQFRKLHAWPPTLDVPDAWEQLYEDAAQGIPDLQPTAADAGVWLNEFVARIAAGQ